MGFLNKIFGTRNAAAPARGHLEPVPGYGRQAYEPYIAQGREVDPGLRQRYDRYANLAPEGQYAQMANDPTGLIDALMGKYKESPFFQRKRDQQLSAARSSAAQGGYAGTPFDQERQMELADIIASGDMQQWLDNALGVQTRGMAGQQHLADSGLAGLEGISGRGYGASNALADYLGSAAGQRAGLEAGSVMGKNQGSQGLLNALMGAGSSMFGAYQGRRGAEALGGSGMGAPNSFTWSGSPYRRGY
jgi:hypothetical protein